MRLRGQDRFSSIYREGTRVRRGRITVIQSPHDGEAPAVGVVAAKRIGGAVQRNRAKRRMREAAARVGLAPRTAYLIVAGDDLESTSFDQLVSWVGDAVSEGREDAT